MRTRTNRLSRLKQSIDASPVRLGVLREAYEWFRDFGELPDDDDHVAYEVVQQALRGGEEQPVDDEASVAKRVRDAKIAYHQRGRPREQWPPTVRAFLFDEALFGQLPHRKVARAAIAFEVAHGGDVACELFAARHGLPTHGTVGAHVIGFPRRWIRPPYEFQGTRLLVRLDNIRARVPQDDERWFEEQAKAIVEFKRTGQLPDDDLHCDSVLANVELDQILAHKDGKEVA
jgi:hypothetical protein